jgi:hypothetical protein
MGLFSADQELNIDVLPVRFQFRRIAGFGSIAVDCCKKFFSFENVFAALCFCGDGFQEFKGGLPESAERISIMKFNAIKDHLKCFL